MAPFREAFLRMEPAPRLVPGSYPKDAANTVAVRLGWYDHRGWRDGSRVRRVLGLRSYQIGGNSCHPYKTVTREYVTHETALRLCEAMNLDPVDFDL